MQGWLMKHTRAWGWLGLGNVLRRGPLAMCAGVQQWLLTADACTWAWQTDAQCNTDCEGPKTRPIREGCSLTACALYVLDACLCPQASDRGQPVAG